MNYLVFSMRNTGNSNPGSWNKAVMDNQSEEGTKSA
jgi:hypothetical protein